MTYRFIICILSIVFLNNVSIAKWASVEDASIKISKYNITLKVKKDGTYEKIVENEMEILKENSRDMASQYKLYYDGDSEKITILEAKTISQGKEYKISQDLIEDKPLASAHNGFDQYRQILLAFPKIEIGSKIYIKYKLDVSKPYLNNFFSDLTYFGNRELITNANIRLSSEIPLHIKVNDPEHALKIYKDKENNFHNMEISLNKDLYQEAINEPYNGIVNQNRFTWVSISSMDKWEDLAISEAKQNYDKIYKQALPKDFEEILNLASKEQAEDKKINIVTSMLNDKIQYLSDRTSVNGRFAPRDLKQTSESQLGDCKDFSAATVAILTKMGYKAQFALVMRGSGNLAPEILPGAESFNHVFVKVTGKNGKIYWVDPTNVQSMTDGIFSDIANKPILILDSENPSYERTPNIDPLHSQIIRQEEVELIDHNELKITGKSILKNESAIFLTAAELFTSKETLQDRLLNMISNTSLDETNKKYIKLPDLKSRIVKDVEVEYSYQQDNKLSKTNLGKAINLEYSKFDINSFIDVSKDTISDIFLGSPYSLKKKTIFKNIKAKNIELLNNEVDSKWLYISRKLSADENNILVVEDYFILKQDLIKNKDLETSEFINLKKYLEQNFKAVSLVFEPIN